MNRLILSIVATCSHALTHFNVEILIRLFKSKKYRKQTLKLLLMTTSLIGTIIIQANLAIALEFGNRGSKVMELQQKLSEMGYFYGSITGYYGTLTENAVRRFQAQNGLRVDGIAGDKTLAALALTEAITTQPTQNTSLLKLGSSGSLVIELQQHLQVMGYYDEAITGYYDLLTQKAVILFQIDVGLKPDGLVGPLTQAAIESKLNLPSPSTTFSTPSSFPERGYIR